MEGCLIILISAMPLDNPNDKRRDVRCRTCVIENKVQLNDQNKNAEEWYSGEKSPQDCKRIMVLLVSSVIDGKEVLVWLGMHDRLFDGLR